MEASTGQASNSEFFEFTQIFCEFIRTVMDPPSNPSGQNSQTLKSEPLQLSNELCTSSGSTLPLSYTHQALTTLESHMMSCKCSCLSLECLRVSEFDWAASLLADFSDARVTHHANVS